MKTQKHNQGSLSELKVMIEKDLFESVKKMSENSGLSIDEIVTVALKRFRSSHADYEKNEPTIS